MITCVFPSQLRQSKQAREERADVRGNAALQKVQLKNVLEDVTSQLDRYAVYNRTRKQPYTVRTNVFASNLARESTQKQHQMDLEHAVEDIFDRHSDVVDMVLPSSVKFENVENSLETVEERSEMESLQSESISDAEQSGVPQVSISSPSVASVTDNLLEKEQASEDELADDSRPSVNLYFPLHSDLSSEVSGARDEVINHAEGIRSGDLKSAERDGDVSLETAGTDGDISHETAPMEGNVFYKSEEDSKDLEPVTPLVKTGKVSSINEISISSSLSASSAEPKEDIIAKPTLDLSTLIKDQLRINSELKAMGKPLNTSVEVEEISPKQPPPISYTKSTPNSSLHSKHNVTRSSISSSGKSSSSFEEIIQELLSSSQASSSKSGEVSRASDSMSQHTLSRDSSLSQTLTPRLETQGPQGGKSLEQSELSSRDVSSTSSRSQASVRSVGTDKSVSSGLSELQKQLARINSHLSEIERIKDKDNLFS